MVTYMRAVNGWPVVSRVFSHDKKSVRDVILHRILYIHPRTFLLLFSILLS
jgi:hypothetical protein